MLLEITVDHKPHEINAVAFWNKDEDKYEYFVQTTRNGYSIVLEKPANNNWKQCGGLNLFSNDFLKAFGVAIDKVIDTLNKEALPYEQMSDHFFHAIFTPSFFKS
jgi:hypothetical protein